MIIDGYTITRRPGCQDLTVTAPSGASFVVGPTTDGHVDSERLTPEPEVFDGTQWAAERIGADAARLLDLRWRR